MPRRKMEEKEEEVDISQQQKKETFATRWFRDYAVNNASDMKIVCDMTARAAEEQFSMTLKSGNTEVYGVIFYGTFLTMLDWLRQQQKTHNKFSIEICNSVNIGYVNDDDSENEKVGNFMPIMEYIGINRSVVDGASVTDEDKTTQNCIRWKELNIKKNVESYKEIQEVAFEKLKTEFKTNTRTSEAVIPLFCIFMDNITSLIRFKYQEAEGTDVSEVSMNVFGLFDVFYSFDADSNQEVIEFVPGISMKLHLKSDEVASRDA